MEETLFNFILVRKINLKNDLASSKIDYTGTWVKKGRLFALESIPQTNLSDMIQFIITEFKNKNSFTKENDDFKSGYFSELYEIQNYIVQNLKQLKK